MSAKRKKEKIRTEFRKNRATRRRKSDLTREYQVDPDKQAESVRKESITGKGALTRKRTVVGDAAAVAETGLAVYPDIDLAACQLGRVLAVYGPASTVETDEGILYSCATRRVLKTLVTEQRNVIAVGDRVWFRPQPDNSGIIERVEPRYGVLSRTSRGRQHVIVANIDQLIIVTSAAEPNLKPHLIDRLLISAEKGRVQPVICINKIDLVAAADLQPLAGVYGQMGYPVIFVSAVRGKNIETMRRQITDCQSVFTGQSGVGKSSLLNALAPDLDLRVAAVSSNTQKGRHTTTHSQLIRLAQGGYVVDTPGMRQFELWDVDRNEVANFFRDLRSYVHDCRFPNCTHTHESDCAVKDAVADGHMDARRYESYCQLAAGE